MEKNEQIHGIISRRRLVPIPTKQHVIINLHTKYKHLALMVVEKSLTKNFIPQSMEGKKIGQMEGRICRNRMVLNPTIQQCIMNLATKYDQSSCHGS